MTGTDVRIGAARAAEASTRERLLRAFLREAGVAVAAAGPLRVELDGPGPAAGGPQVLLVEVTHPSPAGHHRFAPEVRDGDGAVLTHDEVVAAVLAALDRPAGVPAPARVAELAVQIADSTARTARYLAGAPEPWGRGPSERSVLRGHPFHPTPKSAEGFDDDDLTAFAPELGASFRLEHLALDPAVCWQRRVVPADWGLQDGPDDGGTGDGPGGGPRGWPVLPVHPWQARWLAGTPEVAGLLDSGRLRRLGPRGPLVAPTSSVRTVTAPGAPSAWKLPLHVRITHFVRTNPVEHVRRAADASALLARLAPGWHHPGFGVLVETGFRGVDPAVVGEDRAGDLAVLFREPTGDGFDVLAGLLEEGPEGQDPPLLARVYATGSGTPAWLRRHLAIATVPLLRVFDTDGVGFEAHVQNSLLATAGGWPARFRVRDMEGTHVDGSRVRPGQLAASSPLRYEPEEAWRRLRYHAVVNHLGHLVATLGLFGDTAEGELWAVVAAELAAAGTPSAHALTREATLPAKANLTSRFTGRGERPLFVDIPNPIREALT